MDTVVFYKFSIKISLLVFFFKCFDTKLYFIVKPESSLFDNPHPLKTHPFSYFEGSLCVWSENRTVRDVFLSEALKHVIDFPLVLLDYQSTYITANKCLYNILFVIDFSKKKQMFKDRIATNKHVFLVYEGLNQSIDFLNTDPEIFKVFGLAETLFIKESNILKLTSPYFNPRTLYPTSPTLPIQENSTIRLEGRSMNVKIATFNCSLFSILKMPLNTDKHDGIEIRILKELARQINFTWTLIELSGIGKWGEMLPNGSWVGGIMGALENGDADIGFCNVWNVLRYNRIVDFGPQYNVMYYSYMVPRPQKIRGFFIILIRLFDHSVWILLLGTFVIISFLYSKFRCNNYSSLNFTSSSDGVKSMLIVFGVFVASTSHKSSTKKVINQLMLCWSVFSFFMAALICNTIITSLTIPQLSPLIDSVEDIVNENFFWGEPGYDNSSKRSMYFNSADPWQMTLESRYRWLTRNTSRAALQSGKFVFPVQRQGYEYVFINVDGLEPFELQGFRVIKQTLNYFLVSFAFSKHSPLLEPSRTVLQRFYEHGLVEHWKKDVVLKYGDDQVKMLLVSTKSETIKEFRPLTFSNFKRTFRIVVSGWVLAFIVFLMELINKSKQKVVENV